MANELMTVEFESLSGITVKLDAATVRNTLTRGNGKVTDQEVSMFIRTCQAKKLDPFENGEVFLIKYSDNAPASLVVGYFAYIRRADKFPDYRGFKAGICVAYRKPDGSFVTDGSGRAMVDKKEGAAVYHVLGEELVGGWCEVYRERIPGHVETSYMEVTLQEYSTGKSNWTAKPATMVRKVAVSQAFRAAFPNEYEGLYTEDEMIASGAIPATAIDAEPVGPAADNTLDDPEISQEQRQQLFRTAKEYFGANGNEILKEILADHGRDSTVKMPVSVFAEVMGDLLKRSLDSKNVNQETGEVADIEPSDE